MVIALGLWYAITKSGINRPEKNRYNERDIGMGLRLSELQAGTKPVVIEFDEKSKLNLVIKTDWYTPEVESKINNDKTKALRGVSETLADCIVSWDLTDDKDNILPISPTIHTLGAIGLNKILEGVVKESLPNLETPETLEDT